MSKRRPGAELLSDAADFVLGGDTTAKMREASSIQRRREMSTTELQSVEFGLGRSRTGNWAWVSDFQGWLGSDNVTGWEAGRVYIDKVHGGKDEFLTMLLDQRLPEVR